MKTKAVRLPPSPRAEALIFEAAWSAERERLRKIVAELAHIALDALTPAEERIAEICVEAGVAEWTYEPASKPRGRKIREATYLHVKRET